MRFNCFVLFAAVAVSLVGCARDDEPRKDASTPARPLGRTSTGESSGDPLKPNDTVMLATVATISQVRDQKAVESIVRDAFRGADASGDGLLARDEFGEMLSNLDRRVTLSSAFGSAAESSDAGSDLSRAFDVMRGASPSLSETAAVAYVDSRFGEADADDDGALDEVEFAFLVTLLKTGR